MVYVPKQTLTVRDGGVGIVSTATALPLVIGVTNGGVANTLYQYTDPNAMLDLHLGGPAVELAMPVIRFGGGCLLLKTASSTAATNSAISKVAAGASTGTVTVSGSGRLAYRARVRIRGTGTLGTAKFDYSLDNEFSYSEIYTVPAGGTFAIPGTGLTLTFVPGAGAVFFLEGDAHTFTSTPAHYTTADLGTAITALLAQMGQRRIRKVYFSGKNSSATAAATMAAAAASHMAILSTRDSFARGLIDGGDDTTTNWRTSFAAFSDLRLGVVYGDADITSLLNVAGNGTPRVPAVNVVAERASVAGLSENLGRYMSGPLRGVRGISHDEGTNQQFTEAEKVTTLRTYPSGGGFYITNGFLKSPPGSDFLYWDWGVTVDEICETIVDKQEPWTLAKLKAKTDGTGHIDELSAVRIETMVRAALKERLLDPINTEGERGHVSGLSYAVDRTNDFLASRVFRSSCAAVPLSPVEGIETTVGLTRSL